MDVPQQSAAERAFRSHYRDVYRFLLRRTHDHGRAEELTQRVFVDAAASLDDRPDDPPLLAWLYHVAQRRFIDDVRRRRTAEAAELLLPQSEEAPVQYGSDVTKAIRDAIAFLPEEQRVVVVARLLEDRSFAEIAKRANVSEAAAKMRFARGLAVVRDRLADEGFDP